jgi:hypothetical protein
MIWARMLAFHRNRRPGTFTEERISGRRESIRRAQIIGRLLLCDAEKATLAEVAQRLGWEALEELAAVAKPDTLLAWYGKLIANSRRIEVSQIPGSYQS